MCLEEVNFDEATTLEMVNMFNREDKKVATAIEAILPDIAKAIDLIVATLKLGGRLFYLGSGTGGKIGILDATECPPTFGVDDNTVIGIISGGVEATIGWREETEDDEKLAIEDLQFKNFNSKDILIAITASGNTPYALAGVKHAKQLGAKTIGICCNTENKIKALVTQCIVADVGLEILRDSTRLKAGTAQKMILNMLSSCSMIKMGKTYKNLMVDVRPINNKLRKRVIDIICIATGVDAEMAKKALIAAENNTKIAIIMIKKKVSLKIAQDLLLKHEGFLDKVL